MLVKTRYRVCQITRRPSIVFSQKENQSNGASYFFPMIFSKLIANKMCRVLVDPGSLSDIMFLVNFKAHGFKQEDLVLVTSYLVSIKGKRTNSVRYIEVKMTLGERKLIKAEIIHFLVGDCKSLYDVIMGRSSLNRFGIIISVWKNLL